MIYYVKDGEKYWRITGDLKSIKEVLRKDLKDTEILTEKEFEEKTK